MKPPSYTIERRVYPNGEIRYYPKRNGLYYRRYSVEVDLVWGGTSYEDYYDFRRNGDRWYADTPKEAEGICRKDWQRWIDSLPAMITSETPFDPEGV